MANYTALVCITVAGLILVALVLMQNNETRNDTPTEDEGLSEETVSTTVTNTLPPARVTTTTATATQPEPTRTVSEPESVVVPTPSPVADEPPAIQTSQPTETPIRTFTESFDTNFTVEEAASLKTSKHPDWWLSSGAYLISAGGVGSTIMGSLPKDDEWRISYGKSNPIDTDDGYHPQNIFRAVQTDSWTNLRQQANFRVIADNYSDSEFRNSSNGLLFFNRYQDHDNLYYTGIRVDGHVTIKKKINGVYYTLAYEPFLDSTKTYTREANMSLLPKDTWLGLRTDVRTNADGTVSIEVYVDLEGSEEWTLATKAVDDGKEYGGPVFTQGHAGIRIDFMDVEFDNYTISEYRK